MKSTLRTLVGVSFIIMAASFLMIKTQLSITIRDELGNTVENAKVLLYETQDDYNQEKNAVAEGTTDVKGVVKFKELKPISYYVIARKDDKDNSGGGEQTGKLDANRINKVTIVIQ
jgi:hypothetical protein